MAAEESNWEAYKIKFPPAEHHIDKDEYDFVVIGAGPAGLMLTVSIHRDYNGMLTCRHL